MSVSLGFTALLILKLALCSTTISEKFSDINLPTDHLVRYLNAFPSLRDECLKTEICPHHGIFQNSSQKLACWGHESSCNPAHRFQTPECRGDHTGWVQNKQAQLEAFFYQADFGYIKQQISEMIVMCEPTYLEDSSLECTKYLRFCRGRNILIDFHELSKRKDLIRYNMDVLKQGQIGGHCHLHRERLMNETEHMGALQSWAPELRYFETKEFRPIADNKCDIVVEKPTYIMKIDANYNMYHHFCDFINLYASLFVNQSHPLAFHTDTQIIIWESYKYESPFAEAFKAFTSNPVWNLDDVRGKVVCFKNIVLPLLPRMIFGLYYNTPIIYGCENSGLFRAFSEFIIHRLKIPTHRKNNSKIRVTFLLRKTRYRQVLNEDELLSEIDGNEDYDVRRISFERGIPFSKQLEVIRSTDILIGMHGAGLTHLLFLPNWATIFELYNCDDPNCYKDLARLRGINYITWENPQKIKSIEESTQPKGGAHAKFANYEFDREEFANLVEKGAEHVRNHHEFQSFQNGGDIKREELATKWSKIIIWESYKYESPFAEAFKAFTSNPVWNLDDVRGKVVCFKNIVLPLLPRMIFGLYYNTPIIYGCENSGLFRAFSEFIIHRLKIPTHRKNNSKIRVTFLLRKTRYRQVLNEDELLSEIDGNEDYDVRRISFERGIPFSKQLEVIRSTDILIGMHGAGLTHLLFLPNWATIFELYNCDDPNCYKDLARLRGINYITWENPQKIKSIEESTQPKGGAHAKFANYEFDREEFANLVEKGAEHVRNHHEFQSFQNGGDIKREEL